MKPQTIEPTVIEPTVVEPSFNSFSPVIAYILSELSSPLYKELRESVINSGPNINLEDWKRLEIVIKTIISKLNRRNLELQATGNIPDIVKVTRKVTSRENRASLILQVIQGVKSWFGHKAERMGGALIQYPEA